MIKVFIYKIIRLIASGKAITNIKKMYPKWEVSSRMYLYYYQKLKLCFLIFLCGFFIYILMGNLNYKKEILDNGSIRRNGYGGGEKTVELIMNSELIKDKKYNLKIQEKQYDDEQINTLAQQCFKELEKYVLGQNTDSDYVVDDLKFASELDGYPFDITYRTDKPLILSQKGEINRDNLAKEISKKNETGILVEIIITISYFDFKEEEMLYVCIYEKPLSEEEQFIKKLDAKLEVMNSETKESDYYYLPDSIDGYNVYFTEQEDKSRYVILLLFTVVSISVFFLKDRDLDKEVEKRNRQLEYEYPRLINKFTLFYNAGMPIKKIWEKLCSDYEKEKNENRNIRNYLYEEMTITMSQMKDGMRELDAYEEFSKRVSLPKYRVFVSLLEQAVTLGNKELAISLRNESENAFIERKNNAKRLFEEAGTKLLIPMFMMLFVVIIIIMFPAFYSFRI